MFSFICIALVSSHHICYLVGSECGIIFENVGGNTVRFTKTVTGSEICIDFAGGGVISALGGGNKQHTVRPGAKKLQTGGACRI